VSEGWNIRKEPAECGEVALTLCVQLATCPRFWAEYQIKCSLISGQLLLSFGFLSFSDYRLTGRFATVYSLKLHVASWCVN
jgi:hypothetical protein